MPEKEAGGAFGTDGKRITFLKGYFMLRLSMSTSCYRFMKVITIILCINIFVAIISRKWLNGLERPLIYYEYLLLVLLCLWIHEKRIRTALFVGLMLVDLIDQIASFFEHNVINFALKLPQLFRSSFGLVFWLSVGIAFLFLFLALSKFVTLLEVTEQKEPNRHPTVSKAYPIVVFVLGLCLLDVINGSAGWVQGHIKHRNNVNIAGSILRHLRSSINEWWLGRKPLQQLADYSVSAHQQSPAFRYFTSGDRQLLIIVESWGAIQNPELQAVQERIFSDTLASQYLVLFGLCPFFGATSGAEARELLGKERAAYYSVLNNGTEGQPTLVSRMKQQGKMTFAFFSFEQHYGNAFSFRQQLGFDQVFSLQELRAVRPADTELNAENQYVALDDEVALSEAIRQASLFPKTFTYVLTINTHLPFQLSEKHKTSFAYRDFVMRCRNRFPTDVSINHYYRILVLFKSLVHKLKNSTIDEVVIVGDHAPPFLTEPERKLYSSDSVPYVVLRKKSRSQRQSYFAESK